MPKFAAFIDSMRAAFGTVEVNTWIRDGMRDGQFYAEEGGHVIGKPWIGEGVPATVIPLPTPQPEPRRTKR
jgi:hypothetical protein